MGDLIQHNESSLLAAALLVPMQEDVVKLGASTGSCSVTPWAGQPTSCPGSLPTVAPAELKIGCYYDSADDAEFPPSGYKDASTVEACISACANDGYRYASVYTYTVNPYSDIRWEYKPKLQTRCSCGFMLGKWGRLEGSKCDTVCTLTQMEVHMEAAGGEKNWAEFGKTQHTLDCALPCMLNFDATDWGPTVSGNPASDVPWDFGAGPLCGGQGVVMDQLHLGEKTSVPQWKVPFQGRHYSVVYDLSRGVLPFDLSIAPQSGITATQTKRVSECDGTQLDLPCDIGETIKVHAARYGRGAYSSLCSKCEAASTSQCMVDADVTSKVTESCDNKAACLIMVCMASLGFTCCTNIVGRYLQVDYSCIASSMEAPSSSVVATPSTASQRTSRTITDLLSEVFKIDP